MKVFVLVLVIAILLHGVASEPCECDTPERRPQGWDFTCAQQKAFKKCKSDFMIGSGNCCETCRDDIEGCAPSAPAVATVAANATAEAASTEGTAVAGSKATAFLDLLGSGDVYAAAQSFAESSGGDANAAAEAFVKAVGQNRKAAAKAAAEALAIQPGSVASALSQAIAKGNSAVAEAYAKAIAQAIGEGEASAVADAFAEAAGAGHSSAVAEAISEASTVDASACAEAVAEAMTKGDDKSKAVAKALAEAVAYGRGAEAATAARTVALLCGQGQVQAVVKILTELLGRRRRGDAAEAIAAGAGYCGEEAVCTLERDPVCCMEVTFPNLCLAKRQWGAEADACAKGECAPIKCSDESDPVCCFREEVFDNACIASRKYGYIEDFDEVCVKGACEQECPSFYKPVCCNGKTHTNKCQAGFAIGQLQAHYFCREGSCEDQPPCVGSGVEACAEALAMLMMDDTIGQAAAQAASQALGKNTAAVSQAFAKALSILVRNEETMAAATALVEIAAAGYAKATALAITQAATTNVEALATAFALALEQGDVNALTAAASASVVSETDPNMSVINAIAKAVAYVAEGGYTQTAAQVLFEIVTSTDRTPNWRYAKLFAPALGTAAAESETRCGLVGEAFLKALAMSNSNGAVRRFLRYAQDEAECLRGCCQEPAVAEVSATVVEEAAPTLPAQPPEQVDPKKRWEGISDTVLPCPVIQCPRYKDPCCKGTPSAVGDMCYSEKFGQAFIYAGVCNYDDVVTAVIHSTSGVGLDCYCDPFPGESACERIARTTNSTTCD